MSRKLNSTLIRGGRALLAGCLLLGAASWVSADPPQRQIREPVYRVSNAKVDPADRTAQRHPLDDALDVARKGLRRIRQGEPGRPPIRDYTCTMVKRERVDGKLNDYEYMFCKIRNRQVKNGRITVPFSVYLYFLKPTGIKGREVVYVEGRNNNKLCAHEGGAKGRWLPTVWLKPTGKLAMKGQLYPITDSGIDNLVVKLIERGMAERKFPDCDVTFTKNAKINGRVCTMLQVTHPTRRPQYEFHKAQVFIDDELQVPVRYAAYDWPQPGQSQLQVLEEYTYLNMKLNVGLTDRDFDTKNPDYNF
jgi:hypothetical protein